MIDQKKLNAIFEMCDSPDTPGCALGLMQDGEVIYRGNYGMADLERQTPITSSTAFDLASESKQFTATAIAVLAEQNLLTINGSIHDHIPELPDYGHTITLRHLLHHTSGIPEYFKDLYYKGVLDQGISGDELLPIICENTTLDFSPGEKFQYSNTGYVLLAFIVERVTGESFGSYLKDTVFKPAGMLQTTVYEEVHQFIQNKATGYESDDAGGFKVHQYPGVAVPGDGKIYSTIEDLCRWQQYLNHAMLGEKPLLNVLLTPDTLNDGTEVGYGLGLDWGAYFKPYREKPVIGHGGGCAGYQSIMLGFPDQKFSIIILANTRAPACIPLAYKVADVCLF